MAKKGGVIGATAITPFLRAGANSTLDDYVDAIDDLVERIGIDHVGIGTDFTQDQPVSFWRYIGSQQGTKFPSTFHKGRLLGVNDPTLYPKEFQNPDDFPKIAGALANRGYQSEDIKKVIGGNWLRLFREVWTS